MSAAAELVLFQSYKFRNYATIFREKMNFCRGENRMFSFFTDYWLIGRVVLDPAVHYLGPRVLCPLTIGISALVSLFVLTDNLP